VSRRGKFAAPLAAVSLLFAVGLTAVTSAQTTASPKMVTGTGSCTTDANGVCAIVHTLGVVPDAVVVSANTPGQFNAYIVNTVQGSFTDKAFKVRAMFSQTKPKALGTIWVAYVASVGMGAPPTTSEPPTSTPPAISSTVPPTTTPVTSTTAPPPTTATTPVTSTTTAPPAACASPEKIVEQDGRTFDAPGTGGQYYVHNDAWNWQGPNSGQHELLYLCDQTNWHVDSWGFDTPEGEVFMYPSTKFDVTGSCCAGKALSTWPNEVAGRFAGSVSGYGAGSSYNVAWDLWLNGVASGNYTEMMIWTQHGGNAAPAGSRRADWTAPGGQVYEVWWDGNTAAQSGGSYLAFISKNTQLSGTVDIRAFIAESAARGYINANPTLNQLNFGVEVRDTGTATQAAPARFTLTDFALTLK
jgi:hypothetical protein